MPNDKITQAGVLAFAISAQSLKLYATNFCDTIVTLCVLLKSINLMLLKHKY